MMKIFGSLRSVYTSTHQNTHVHLTREGQPQQPHLPTPATIQRASPHHIAHNIVLNVSPFSVLPDEILLNILSHLGGLIALNRVKRVCNKWLQLISDPRLWNLVLTRNFLVKAKYFAHVSNVTGIKPNWYQLANVAVNILLNKGTSLNHAAHKLQTLPDSPAHQNVYIDSIDGCIVCVNNKWELEFTPPSSTLSTQFSISSNIISRINPKFTKPSLHIVYMRSTTEGRILLINVSQNINGTDENQLIACGYDCSMNWVSDLNVHAVYSGGLDLGMGWDPSVKGLQWNRRYNQARQKFSYENLLPFVFTTTKPTPSTCSKNTNPPSVASPTVQTFSLWHLSEMEKPLFTKALAPGEELLYIDPVTSDLFVVTVKHPNKSITHSIYFCKDLEDNPSNLEGYVGYNVLASDPANSAIIAQSLREENKQNPLILIRKMIVDDDATLVFNPLPIPAFQQYIAQLNGNRMAIAVQGPDAPCVYVAEFNKDATQEDSISFKGEKIPLHDYLPKHTIRSITLFNDFLIILTNDQYNAVGATAFYKNKKVAFFHRATDKSYNISPDSRSASVIKVKAIIGREDRLLLCVTEKKGLVGLNTRNATLVSINNSSGTSVYRAGILTTESDGIKGVVGIYEIRSYLEYPPAPSKKESQK